MIAINLKNKNVTYHYPSGIGNKANLSYSDIILLKNKKLLIGTFGNGLYSKDENNKFTKIELTNLPNDISIYSLLEDSNSRIWIGTYGKGAYKINKDREVEHFTTELNNPRSLHYNDVLKIYEDKTGVIWFGTDGGGASYYDEYLNKFNFVTNNLVPDNVSVEVIRAIAEDEENIWIGTSGKGLTKFNGKSKSWKTYKTDNSSLTTNRIMSLKQIKQGVIIGTQEGGLYLYNDNFIKPLDNTITKHQKFKTIWTIKQAPNESIWLGTRDFGLVHYNIESGVIKNFYKNNSKDFPVKSVRSLEFEDTTKLWIGTDNKGVFEFNLNNEKFIQNQALKINSQIKCLFFDKSSKILWIGTNGKGIFAYNTENKKIKQYTQSDGLANNVIYGILQDNYGKLWLSSNKGIIELIPETDFDKQPKITNYNNYDGLATEFNTGAYFKSKKGILYFGGLDGLYWFNPNEIKENYKLPETIITKIEIYDEKIPLKNNANLSHNQNTISFAFANLQFSLPEKNLYQYKLEGYDEDWVFSENRTFARYSKLPPGKYSFLVKSSNYDGIWNNTPAQYDFVINKPWYLSNVAIIIYFLLFIILLYYILKYFEWKWKMEMELKLEKEEATRFKELNDYKSKLYSNISHEFRTPLTLINSSVINEIEKNTQKNNENLNSVYRNTNRMINLVDQMLELTKLDAGTMKVNEQPIQIGYFLQMIIDNYLGLLKSEKLTLKTIIPENVEIISDPDFLEKIINNLFSNVIKYAPKETNVEFISLLSEDEIKIEITNNIKKIPSKNPSKLFNRFYRYDSEIDGTGIGLSLVKELTELLNGNVNVAYIDNNSKIRFSINIPIKINKTSLNQENNKDENQETIHQEKPQLLIVEDNNEIRAHVINIFQDKYTIIEAKDGQEGINKAINLIPDVIISDVIMPFKTGIELCETVKNDEKTSHIPIIILTGKSGTINETIGLKNGADEYITKPFNPIILKLKVDNLINSRKKLQEKYSSGEIIKLKEIAYTTTDEKFISKLQEILEQNITDSDFSAEKFADALAMSRMQLHRKITALTGQSTTAFIRIERLKLAKKLLDNKNITVAETAYATGFNTPSYFIKCYKEVYGYTPKDSENK